MADVKMAVEDVMREEDGTLSGVITDTRGDKGGKTRFGIASKFHPELLQTTFYTTMSTADALQVAVNLMTQQYAAPLKIESIASQRVATKLLSFGVDAGVRSATSTMQNAVNQVLTLAPPLRLDGVMGVLTLNHLNRCMSQSLLDRFRLGMIAHYNAICRYDPVQREFLCGWIDRALA